MHRHTVIAVCDSRSQSDLAVIGLHTPLAILFIDFKEAFDVNRSPSCQSINLT